jgi:hypothetical protein
MAESGEQVIILDPQWQARLSELRALCAADRLICPGCRQPLWSKVGTKKRPHFAHKHLSDCPSSNESPELLHARAALYHWLASKFGREAVRVEVKLGPDDIAVPRHFDCTAETKHGTKLAYCVFERQVRPDDRDAIRAAAESSGHVLVPVFTTTVMRRNDSPKNLLNLSTTERAFLVRGDYDDLYPHEYMLEGSLHYLDGEHESLTTLRAMSCTEPPQQFTGTEISTPLAQVTVHGPTGQFVHPTEFERLKVHRQRVAEEQRREAERRAREEKRQREWEERRARELAEKQKVWDAIGIRKETPKSRMRLEMEERARQASRSTEQTPLVQPLSIYDGREAPCETCGAMTPERDWIIFSGKTGLCRCRACIANH